MEEQKIVTELAKELFSKHAHTLAAIQRVISAMVYKKFQKKIDVLVDVNDYRDVQKERLTKIADNVAQRVLEEKRSARLSSFSPYERKIIHEHISNHYHTLGSQSEGEGRERVLVVSLKE